MAPDWQGEIIEILRVETRAPYAWVRWVRVDGFVREARVHFRELGWV